MGDFNNPLKSDGSKKMSKQLQYYHRKTGGKRKRKYTHFAEQENPSRQLKKYYENMDKANSTVSESPAGAVETTSDSDMENAEEIEFEADMNSSCVDTEADEESDITFSSDESDTSDSSLNSEDSPSESESEVSDACKEPEETKEAENVHSEEEEQLYEGSKISKVLSFVLIVSFVLKHNLSKAAWADLLRLMTTLLGERCKKTFQSVYKMKLFMKEYFGTKDPTNVTYCSNCLNHVEGSRCTNDSCSGARLSSFLDLHFEEKIKDLFRDSEFINLLKKGKNQVKHAVSGSIHDIFHGLDYKNFIHPGGFLSKLYNISFTINTDGVNKYSSSKAGHLWPVYVMINEIPKEYRFKKKYIIPAYIYCDKHDPNMLTFLNPLVEKLNHLNTSGIDVPDSADGNINVRCMLFVATADLPARASLMNMKQYNGKCSCHLCKSEGKGYGPNKLHRCWPHEQIEKRTHEDQVKYAKEAKSDTAVKGVKGHCIFAKLSYPFDLVRSFAIDWMHCVCLGVVKYIMKLQMSAGNKDKVYHISTKNAVSMSHKLLSIKPPDIVGRLPRSLDDLKHWKATELKNWLLHYSLPVLYKTLNPLYVFHWTLLVGGIGILCSDSITNDDLKQAEDMLNDFVILTAILYGETKCTMNVHMLQHFVYYVKRRGPLWAYSCFAFESVNAYIKPLIHGTHHAMEQIGCAIGLCYGLSNFTKKTLQEPDIPKESKVLLRSLNGYTKIRSKTSAKVNGGYLRGKDKNTIDKNIKTLVRLFVVSNKLPSDYELESAYLRFESDDGQIFYSSGVKTRKTDSTVIEYKNQNNKVCYGRVKHFLKICNRGICICSALEESPEQLPFFNEKDCREILQTLALNNKDNKTVSDVLKKYHNTGKHLVKHHVPIKQDVTERLRVLFVEQIRRKCVFIDVLSNNWMISRFPNIVEHN